MYHSLNRNGTDTFLRMQRAEFENKPIFGFNFALDVSDNCGIVGHVNTLRRGTLRIQIKIANALTDVINVLAYCEYDNIIEINSGDTVSNKVFNGFTSN